MGSITDRTLNSTQYACIHHQLAPVSISDRARAWAPIYDSVGLAWSYAFHIKICLPLSKLSIPLFTCVFTFTCLLVRRVFRLCSALSAVRRTSELPATPDERLVRTGDGLHAVSGALEEDHHLGARRAARSHLLHHLHHVAEEQGNLYGQHHVARITDSSRIAVLSHRVNREYVEVFNGY